jgi:hypothetical protein
LGGRIQIRVGEHHVLEQFIGPDIPLLQLHHSSSRVRENPIHCVTCAYVSALTGKVRAAVSSLGIISACCYGSSRL